MHFEYFRLFYFIMIGIYKITSPSGKVYIGQSVNVLFRIKRYKNLTISKYQTKLHNSFKKYGYDNHVFEILCECLEHELNDLERYYQELYNVLNHGLNCKYTKTQDRSGRHSEETKQKISNKAKGRIASEKTRQNMSKSHLGHKRNLGRKLTTEHKLKISKALSGVKCPQRAVLQTPEILEKKRLKMLGRKHTPESKKKMSLAQMGNKKGKNKVMSDKEKNNLKKLFSKIILDTSSGIFYEGTKEAAFYNNLNPNTLKNRLNGNLKNQTSLIYA